LEVEPVVGSPVEVVIIIPEIMISEHRLELGLERPERGLETEVVEEEWQRLQQCYRAQKEEL